MKHEVVKRPGFTCRWRPGKVRLSLTACASDWTLAQEVEKRHPLFVCRDCPFGARNAGRSAEEIARLHTERRSRHAKNANGTSPIERSPWIEGAPERWQQWYLEATEFEQATGAAPNLIPRSQLIGRLIRKRSGKYAKAMAVAWSTINSAAKEADADPSWPNRLYGYVLKNLEHQDTPPQWDTLTRTEQEREADKVYKAVRQLYQHLNCHPYPGTTSTTFKWLEDVSKWVYEDIGRERLIHQPKRKGIGLTRFARYMQQDLEILFSSAVVDETFLSKVLPAFINALGLADEECKWEKLRDRLPQRGA